jgi:VWFA-related protein
MRILVFALLLGVAAQAAPQPQRPVIRSNVTYVSSDVTVRDEHGQFVADLRPADFEVYEDGVKQAVAGFWLTHGGRLIKEVTPAGAAVEGVLLPPPRPSNDSSGRVFLIFVDDLHFEARQTPRVRALLTRIRHELVHPGDLVGMVSSGYSSISIDLTYDYKRLDEGIGKVMGAGLMPSEIIGGPEGAQGPVQVRHNVHAAFSTAYEILQKLEQVHNRRKAFIYVSNGYDFDPYAKSRAKAAADRFAGLGGQDSGQVPDRNPFGGGGNEFAAADLAAELSELTREATRANTTFYTIDPRGLAAGADIDQTTLDQTDWQDHLRETQSSLRVIAELTGGFATINRNDVGPSLKRIDDETSDYYVVGYYSSNPDPLKKRRTIEIRIVSSPKRRADRYQLSYKTSYTLKPAR